METFLVKRGFSLLSFHRTIFTFILMDIEVAIKVLNSAIARENVMRNIFRPHMYLIIYLCTKKIFCFVGCLDRKYLKYKTCFFLDNFVIIQKVINDVALLSKNLKI